MIRRVLRHVITGLVSILLDAILRSSGGGGGGSCGLQAGAWEGGGGGAGRGGAGARATRGLVHARAGKAVSKAVS